MSGIVNGAGINETKAHVSHSHSRFNLREPLLDTHRFGEYHPSFVLDGISGDSLPFRCVDDVRSYTLKAPLMQDVLKNKDFFMVTLRCILPLQAERVVTNPNLGDDVPPDAYTSVSDFISKIQCVGNVLTSAIISNSLSTNPNEHATAIVQRLIFLESVFSRGSLLASLGCNLSRCLSLKDSSNVVENIDTAVDNLGLLLATLVTSKGYLAATIDGEACRVVPDVYSYRLDNGGSIFTGKVINLRDFFQMVRDTSNWAFTNFVTADATSLAKYSGSNALNYIYSADFPIDIARLWAYHLVCAEYFSNDKVDYIYSADLFRQYISSLILNGDHGNVDDSFSWNGVSLQYDYLSAHYFDAVVADFGGGVSDLQYFLTLFGYKRSLRFKDYFTGSRTRPLAMVTNPNYDTDVAVNNNAVSVIDVTRSIQVQRFLNAVNASGRKFGEYISSIFGVTPNKDMHEPIFLAHSSDNLFAAEVENTGAAQQTQQNSVTAVFRGKSNNYEYSVSPHEPCIIIGVTSYDIERVYPDSINRSFFIRDRFDMFNPMMQYIGDQGTYVHELQGASYVPFGSNFGYQFRDMQYKQLYPRCAGAFAGDKLPGYAFLYQRDTFGTHVSPDFIRARNSELDPFYLSLTSYSLGNYFHFICKQINTCDAKRPMIAQPQIL